MKTILFTSLRAQPVERLSPIRKAKCLGLKVAVLAQSPPEKVVQDEVDYIIYVDNFSEKSVIPAVMNFHQSNKIHGVLCWTDRDVELVAKLTENLNLPGTSIESAKLARNKYLMRKALENSPNSLCPKFQRVTNENDLLSAANTIGMDAILKPTGASGSKAIFRINSDSNLSTVWREIKSSADPEKDPSFRSALGEFIYEEYMDGIEISVDGLIQNGKIYFAGATEKEVTPDFSIEYNGFFPARICNEQLREVLKNSSETLRAMGLDNCPFHLEARLTSNGFRVLEVAARAGGGYIASHLIDTALGKSVMQEAMLKNAVGEDFLWEVDPYNVPFAAGMWDHLASEEGIINKVEGIRQVLELEGVSSIIPYKDPGDCIKLPPQSYTDVYVITSFASSTDVDKVWTTLTKANSLINIQMKL